MESCSSNQSASPGLRACLPRRPARAAAHAERPAPAPRTRAWGIPTTPRGAALGRRVTQRRGSQPPRSPRAPRDLSPTGGGGAAGWPPISAAQDASAKPHPLRVTAVLPWEGGEWRQAREGQNPGEEAGGRLEVKRGNRCEEDPRSRAVTSRSHLRSAKLCAAQPDGRPGVPVLRAPARRPPPRPLPRGTPGEPRPPASLPEGGRKGYSEERPSLRKGWGYLSTAPHSWRGWG